jgi:CNT family concentrative nucleoside transporter
VKPTVPLVQPFNQELPSRSLFDMADMREQHNSSPMPGVARNDDPALDIAREHDHAHVHHSARAAHPDNIVYTTGTTDEKTSKILEPSAHDSHLHQRHAFPNEKHDLEKAGGYDYEIENGTPRSSTDPELEAEKKKPWWHPSVIYRKYRLPIHILIGMFFTG